MCLRISLGRLGARFGPVCGGSGGCFEERVWIAGRRNTDCSGWMRTAGSGPRSSSTLREVATWTALQEVREVEAWGPRLLGAIERGHADSSLFCRDSGLTNRMRPVRSCCIIPSLRSGSCRGGAPARRFRCPCQKGQWRWRSVRTSASPKLRLQTSSMARYSSVSVVDTAGRRDNRQQHSGRDTIHWAAEEDW